MRKKRLRGTQREPGGEPRLQDLQDGTSRRRSARVRNRLAASIALVAVAVLGAGAPAVLMALDDSTGAQRLVALAGRNRDAVTLAHSLADERDAMTAYVAAGRTTASGGGVSESQRARVDRQVREVRQEAPGSVRRLLDNLPELRQQALTGHGSAEDVFASYTTAVQALNQISADLARRLPADAGPGAAAALAPLGRATEQASATRGLLVAALAGGGAQPTLTSAAQRTRVREDSALADFRQLAPAAAREAYDRTVNGTEVTTAERYTSRLTDRGRLSGGDLRVDEDRVDAALSARITRMRGVESSLASAEVARLARSRDDDVTALEKRIALVGGALLLALGISVQSARSMTRPLAALRLGTRRVAADPASEEPVDYTGRNDEFGDAVRAVNELHAKAVRAQERATGLGTERTRLVGERQRLADERDALRRERDEIAARLEGLRSRVHSSFVSLALRTLGLIERQLAVIEGMEEQEQDPDRLQTLFQLDHLATGMRRYSENLLVIAGSENTSGHPGPVPLLDVLRASISEVERYDRVQIQSLPPHAQVAGYAADSISHLVAELLENASSFSPPDARVQVSGWLLESGEVMLSIQDEGIGMTPERMAELNDRLADPVPDYCQGPQPEDPLGLGLYVVTRLAARHGVRVQLRQQQPGGVAAVVVLPTKILPAGPPGAGLPPAPPAGAGVAHGAAGLPAFPGSEAEANSGALPAQPRSVPAAAADPAPEPDEEAPAAGDAEWTAASVPRPSGTAVAETPAPWAVPGAERSPGPAFQDGAPYPMEPTPPRGHPTPGSAGDPPALPRRTPTSGLAPVRPAAPVAQDRSERTIEFAVRHDDVGGLVGGHGIRPVGADAWGPAGTDPYVIGPDEHTRAAEHPRTDKGLPQRTPRNVERRESGARERSGAVDAEELRRRLGGFQRGALEGRRDAEAEIAARARGREHGPRGGTTERTGAHDEGDTVEEARG
ncbi:nitrate- and nitrite sensing domain-containing protein [Streptomyces sp. NA02950]|uniref:sensor histidine kinase n=1 Tax=Streptomyces sp. NA02950 TaxID=2742137 RepID=UPI00159158E6|nr:nitrate- and nitrite sensing domain-containing protein [Streptomyces sp. NA02950]QKV92584.1 nitrate- and nitrite sensing domain-containing protein [Streptomyces sp. NA02950]